MTATAIEWTDVVWNPTTGCDQVSPGCDRCYALTMAKRLNGMGAAKYQRDGDPRTSGPGFGITEHRGRVLEEPLHWRKPRRVFVNSMSDLFHDGVSDGFIGSVFEVMAKTPQHTYQVLTKRHGRMRSLLNRWAAEGTRQDWAGPGTAVFRRDDACWVGPIRWPLPNVWLGVSVEDQKRADLRIPALLDTPAAVRFLSCEPLLAPVDLGPAALRFYEREQGGYWNYDLDTPVISDGLNTGKTWVPAPPAQIDWVIAGGESGPGARPMHPAWARQLRDQCSAATVPFFFKQWGDWAPTAAQHAGDLMTFVGAGRGCRVELFGDISESWSDGGRTAAMDGPRRKPGSVLMLHVGKRAAGRELDGRTWDELPALAGGE